MTDPIAALILSFIGHVLWYFIGYLYGRGYESREMKRALKKYQQKESKQC